VGDGNFHQALFFRPDVAGERKKVADCIDTMVEKAIEMGGTVSVSQTYSFIRSIIVSLTDHHRVSMVLVLGRR
jgi:hypothetical protein